MTPTIYPYKPKPFVALVVIVFFGLCALFMGNKAMTNENVLIIKGIIHLSPNGASIFFGGSSAIGGLFTIAGFFMLFNGVTSKQTLVLSDSELSIPRHAFTKKKNVVRFNEIQELTIQIIVKEKVLTIFHSQGKASISQSMLPSSDVFEKLFQTISERAQLNCAS